MTLRRDPTSIAGAVTNAIRVIGPKAAAAIGGTSDSRLRQLSNPMRGDTPSLELAVRLDVACARAGGGTPLFDVYRRQLLLANVRPAWEVRAERFMRLGRRIARLVLLILGDPRQAAAA